MSRSAVSVEAFVNAAHFDVVSFPSKPSLRLFEHAVVLAAFLADLRRHAVEPLRAPF
jgi:hypothetical protein